MAVPMFSYYRLRTSSLHPVTTAPVPLCMVTQEPCLETVGFTLHSYCNCPSCQQHFLEMN